MLLAPPFLWLASGLLTLVAMEPWAAFLHRWVWHKALWTVHRTHHREPGDIDATRAEHGGWQANDALSLLHAPVACTLILYGCTGPVGVLREVAYGTGIGMTGFGVAYVLVHDGLAHGRLPLNFLLRWRWVRRVRAAHRVHHRTGGPPFGLFCGPFCLPEARAVRSRARLTRRP